MDAAARRELRIALVGATGVVGGQLAELLAERNFSSSELKLFASERGAVETVAIGGEDQLVAELTAPSDLAGFDLAILAVSPAVAADIVRARPGPILIDLSAAGRSASNILLAAPGLVSRDRIGALASGDVVAIPHPSAYALATVLKALGDPGVAAATLMLGASTGGKDEIDKLMEESADLLNARLEVDDDEQQRAFNIYPVDDEAEIADAIASQVGALLGAKPRLTMRVVRVPIFYGTALSIAIPGTQSEDWAARLREAPGVILVEEEMPPSVIDSAGQEAVVVSLKQNPDGAVLWCVIDNARLAALNALWIAENLTPAKNRA